MAATRTPLLISGGSVHRTLAEQAYETLHQAILSGELEPGTRLPIDDLAGQLNMSNVPIREALKKLDARGMVEHIPHRGARVTPLSIEDVREIYEVRLELEPLAIARACEAFTSEHAAVARGWLDRLNASINSDDDTIWLAHTGFHFSLYSASGSKWLMRSIEPVWASSERYRRAFRSKTVKDSRMHHGNMLQMCIDHDAPAAMFEIRQHLVLVGNIIAREMGFQGDLFAAPSERDAEASIGAVNGRDSRRR
jgi:DNA-binding GntR family transcriptional regulator